MKILVANLDEIWLWHKRFCHINFDKIVEVSTTFVLRDFPRIVKPNNMMCKEYVMEKFKKTFLLRKMFTTFEIGDCAHRFKWSYKD